jgi:hypothetical protein
LTGAQKYSIDCTFLHHFQCMRARARSLASGIQGRRKARQKTATNGREGGVDGGKERRGEDAARNARTWNSRLAFAATPAKVRLDKG